jgi:D-xylonolactonase
MEKMGEHMAVTQEPRSVWNIAAELGEGPVWDGRDHALWFVDIKARKVHRFDPESGDKRSWNAPEQIGFILPAEGGGFVAGLQSGLYRFDPASGAFDKLAAVEPDKPGNRLNDAVVDPQGRIWFGSMHDGESDRSGAFYCYAAGDLTHTRIDNIVITNGPAVSPDGRTLYFIDTLERTLDAADIGPDGTLSNIRPFVRFDPEHGNPDGPTVDSEGHVWTGMYGGWCALRYSPAGELVETVRFPVANITKLAFGGDDLRTVYATTARQLLSPDEIARQPEIGNLFAFRVDVPGIPCPLARI